MWIGDYDDRDPLATDKVVSFLATHSPLGDSIDFRHDYITTAYNDQGAMVGLAAGRPIIYSHAWAIDRNPISRHIADRLLDFSLGKLSALGERQVMFLVDVNNINMHEWLRTRLAYKVRDVNATLYTIEIPKSCYPRR